MRALSTSNTLDQGAPADFLLSHDDRAICPIPPSQSTSDRLARPAVSLATAPGTELINSPVAAKTTTESSHLTHHVRLSPFSSTPGLSVFRAKSFKASEDGNSSALSSKSSSLARRWFGPYAADAKSLAHLLVASPSRIQLAHIGDYQEQRHLAEATHFYRLKKATRGQKARPEGDKPLRCEPQRAVKPVKRLIERAASDLAAWRDAGSKEAGSLLHEQMMEQEVLHVRLRGSKEARMDLDL